MSRELPAGASVGVDGCPGGWVAVALAPGASARVRVFASVADLWETWGQGAARVLVDTPVGLPGTSASRACDREARAILGWPRSSSVFNPPVRPALTADSWEEAARINETVSGRRLSKQSWGILPRVREVDDVLQADPARQAILREAHPELLFHALAGNRPTSHSKKSARGMEERLAVLQRHFPEARGVLRGALADHPRSVVRSDDVVDALVSAVVGIQFGDRLESIPAEPPRDDTGLAMEMVVPPGIR